MAVRWFSSGTLVSSTNKNDDITEILLKMVLNTTTLTLCISLEGQRWMKGYLSWPHMDEVLKEDPTSISN